MSNYFKDLIGAAEHWRQTNAVNPLTQGTRVFPMGGLMNTPVLPSYVGAPPSGAYPASVNPLQHMMSDQALIEMVKSRMRWLNVPFNRMFMTQISEETVVSFIVLKDGKHCTIEDGASLFPSDTFVTQLRLLQEGN